MPALAALVASLLRFRARACVVLACVAAMLFTAGIASAQLAVQAQTRVWDFSFAEPLNIRLNTAATPRTHLENRSGSLKLASESLLAAKGGAVWWFSATWSSRFSSAGDALHGT